MSNRLQVLVPKELDARMGKAAQRARVSKGEWVRRVIQEALDRPAGGVAVTLDPVARLAGLEAPTGDIDRMLADIDAGRA